MKPGREWLKWFYYAFQYSGKISRRLLIRWSPVRDRHGLLEIKNSALITIKRQGKREGRTAAEKYLSQVVGRTAYDGVRLRYEVLNRNVAENIADYATRKEVDLIVIATHGRSGISRWVWGSVADRILRSSCVPVLMVRAPGCIPGVQAFILSRKNGVENPGEDNTNLLPSVYPGLGEKEAKYETKNHLLQYVRAYLQDG